MPTQAWAWHPSWRCHPNTGYPHPPRRLGGCHFIPCTVILLLVSYDFEIWQEKTYFGGFLMKLAITKFFILFLFPAGGFFGGGIFVLAMDSDAGGVELIKSNDPWKYFKGDQAPSTPGDKWRDLDFDDTGWKSGPSGFGYGDDDDTTVIDDMRNNFLTVYIRKVFEAPNLPAQQGVELVIDYDDGFIAYLDSKEVMRKHMPSGESTFETEAEQHEAGTPVVIPLGTVGELLAPGKHVLAIEGHNRNLGSTDFTLNPTLRTTTRAVPGDDTTPQKKQNTLSLVAGGAKVKYFVPSDSSWASTWMQGSFTKLERWVSDTGAIGFGEVFETGAARRAYNDCFKQADDETANQVTAWTIHNGNIDAYSGRLKDFSTGDGTGMPTVTFRMGTEGIRASAASGGRPAIGTPIYELFHNDDGWIVDFGPGTIYYGSTGWWQEITFTELNPNARYSFAGSAVRSTSYPERTTLVTIQDADGYVWNSSSGVGDSGKTATFLAGDNRAAGEVVRWDDIAPGADGDFTIRSEATEDSDGGKAYPINGFMLEQAVGKPTDPRLQAMVGTNATLWARIEFTLDTEPSELKSLTLKMRYDDAFVAYLNGTEVKRSNFTGTPSWNSQAAGNRDNSLAAKFETFDISSRLSVLQPGTNVLAVQVLNESIQDPNLFFLGELTAERKPKDDSLSYNDAINLPNGLRTPEGMNPPARWRLGPKVETPALAFGAHWVIRQHRAIVPRLTPGARRPSTSKTRWLPPRSHGLWIPGCAGMT
jgi:hypothetical protein